MPPRKQQKEEASTLTTEEELSLEMGDLSMAEVDDGGLLSDFADEEAPVIQTREDEVSDTIEPLMSDPSWSEFVMKQFEPDEQDEHGNPNVVGLRRVSRKLLGPIIESEANVVQAPNYIKADSARLAPTTVRYTVAFLWWRDLPDNFPAQRVVFSDVADVYFGNCDEEFLRFPSATAATRAEARCLRKALQLQRGIISAEERTEVPLEEASCNGLITNSQITFMNVLCRRNNVSVHALINKGKKKYEFVEEVPYETASKINEYLSGIQNKGVIPEDLMGYDPDWRKAQK